MDAAAISEFRKRRKKRLGKRYDAEGDTGTHGNTRLPFGLCKAAGIDTTGMTPAEAWAALEGKTGIKPKEAYKELEKKRTERPAPTPEPEPTPTRKPEPDGKPTDEKTLEPTRSPKRRRGKTESSHSDPAKTSVTKPTGKETAPPEETKRLEPKVEKVDPEMQKLFEDMKSGAVSKMDKWERKAYFEKVQKTLLDKYGEDASISYYHGGVKNFRVNNVSFASYMQMIAEDRYPFSVEQSTAGANDSLVNKLLRMKDSTDPTDVFVGYEYSLSEARSDTDRKVLKKERKKRIEKLLPRFDDCKTAEEVAIRLDSLGLFTSYARTGKNTDRDAFATVAKGAEKMFSIFPCMVRRVRQLDLTRHKPGAFAWVESIPESPIMVDVDYASNNKRFCNAYEFSTITGFHPPGTTNASTMTHEFTHVIDLNLSRFVNNRGGFPGLPKGAMLSTQIAADVSKELGVPVDALKQKVCRYAEHKYDGEPALDDMEFLAECMSEYFESPHPRKIAKAVGDKLIAYIKKYWGDNAVNEAAIK